MVLSNAMAPALAGEPRRSQRLPDHPAGKGLQGSPPQGRRRLQPLDRRGVPRNAAPLRGGHADHARDRRRRRVDHDQGGGPLHARARRRRRLRVPGRHGRGLSRDRAGRARSTGAVPGGAESALRRLGALRPTAPPPSACSISCDAHGSSRTNSSETSLVIGSSSRTRKTDPIAATVSAPMLNVTRTRSPARSVQPTTPNRIPPADTSQHCAMIARPAKGVTTKVWSDRIRGCLRRFTGAGLRDLGSRRRRLGCRDRGRLAALGDRGCGVGRSGARRPRDAGEPAGPRTARSALRRAATPSSSALTPSARARIGNEVHSSPHRLESTLR